MAKLLGVGISLNDSKEFLDRFGPVKDLGLILEWNKTIGYTSKNTSANTGNIYC